MFFSSPLLIQLEYKCQDLNLFFSRRSISFLFSLLIGPGNVTVQLAEQVGMTSLGVQ